MQLAGSAFTAVLLIPTGIGATVGGFAGDALPVARVIGSTVDCLVTHPNVLNGANLYWSSPNILYVEGYALDQWAEGAWQLQAVHHNRLGVILDRDIPADLQLRHLQVVGAAKATLGLDILAPVVTPEGLGVQLAQGATGASWGTIKNPQVLLASAQSLLEQGAQAIAIVSWFPNSDSPSVHAQIQQYRQAQAIDPLAGVEAVISHLVTRELKVPCAHAPAMLPLPLDPTVHDYSCAEELGFTFLPCVLVGLSRAPRIVGQGGIDRQQVQAVITPLSACGGSGLLALASLPHVQIIAVADNDTAMAVFPENVGIPRHRVIRVHNYLEAVGVLSAMKAGIHWHSLMR